MRELSSNEVSLVAGGNQVEEVVVTGHVYTDYASVSGTTFVSIGNGIGTFRAGVGTGIYNADGELVGLNQQDQTDTNHYTVVNVHVDSSHQAAAEQAAKNLGATLDAIRQALAGLDPNTQISWNGRQITAANLAGELENTQWVISDTGATSNGGFGAASAGANGAPNVDTISYSILTGEGSYASSGYTHNEGMEFIVLHELGHMTSEGAQFNNLAYHDWQLDHTSYNSMPFNSSEYWLANERFADDFARSAGGSLGLTGVDTFSMTLQGSEYGFGADEPGDIYSTHQGW